MTKRVTLTATTILLLSAPVGLLVAARGQAGIPSTPVTIDSALESYRKSLRRTDTKPTQQGHRAKPFRPPQPGVYIYRMTGKEWITKSGLDIDRDYPARIPAVVHRRPNNMWTMEFLLFEEHVEGHRQFSSPGRFKCEAHWSEIEFFGQREAPVHECGIPMRQVVPASKEGFVHETICEANGSVARVVTSYLGQEAVSIDGQRIPAHRVLMETFLSGNVEGYASGEAWFDPHTGIFLRMIRRVDTVFTSPVLGEVEYGDQSTYELESLTPLQ